MTGADRETIEVFALWRVHVFRGISERVKRIAHMERCRRVLAAEGLHKESRVISRAFAQVWKIERDSPLSEAPDVDAYCLRYVTERSPLRRALVDLSADERVISSYDKGVWPPRRYAPPEAPPPEAPPAKPVSLAKRRGWK